MQIFRPERIAVGARGAEAFLRRFGVLVVVVGALLYYGSYYRSGIPLSGEGGTIAVLSMRLMEGQRPIADTFLGYNILWFAPVTWLFEWTGPSYTALRMYFFAICTATAVMAFLVVRRVTGLGWLALLAAAGPLLMPGMLFRNYMGFLAVINMAAWIEAFATGPRAGPGRWLRIGLAGAVLGLTFLTRIDLGLFFSMIAIGLIVFDLLRGGFGPLRNATRAVVSLALVTSVVLLTHLPIYLDARARGWDKPFLDQYFGWIGIVRYLAAEEAAKLRPTTPAPTPAGQVAAPQPPEGRAAAPAPAPAPSPAQAEAGKDIDSSDYLQKRSLGEVVAAPTLEDRVFTLALYLPVLVTGVLAVLATLGVFASLWLRNDGALRDSTSALVAVGAALTLFPQYFFFRPDTPHLSEFMVPMFPAMAIASWAALRWRPAVPRTLAALVIALCLADTAIYTAHGMTQESAGSIMARRRRHHLFTAENGVSVFVKKSELPELVALRDILATHTRPGDYVVCYPYAPTVNLLANRPSYEYNLYVDNAHNVADFDSHTRAEIAKYRPAAILIDNKDINKSEASRFKNWAAPTYEYIRSTYHYAGTFRRQEIYLRPDLVQPPNTP